MRRHWRQHRFFEQFRGALFTTCLKVRHFGLDVRHLIDLEATLFLAQRAGVRSRSVGVLGYVAARRMSRFPGLCSEKAVENGRVHCKNGYNLYHAVRY
jgi:hypothetical protein